MATTAADEIAPPALRPLWLFVALALAIPALRMLGVENAGAWVESWVARCGDAASEGALALLVWRALLAIPVVHAAVGRALRDEPASDASWPHERRWFAAGLAVTALGLALVELGTPYFFAQDDNFSQFMPVVVHGCENLFRGTFPVWNPHQMMGAPTAAVGTYALTYPVTWLAYAVARWGLGDPYLFCDVFCAAHLLAGYVATWRAARAVELSAPLAASGALAFVLSGFFLVMGRSWFYMAPVAFWAPLLAAQVEALRRDALPRGWAVVTGVAAGAFFHAGNAQLWAYALLLLAVAGAVLFATGAVPRARLRACAVAGLVMVAVTAPLLVPQLAFVRGVTRHGGVGDTLRAGLVHMLLPLPPSLVGSPNRMGATADDLRTVSHLFYSGTLFSAAGLALALSLATVRLGRAGLRVNVWAVCAALALLAGFGNPGVVWTLLAKLPLFAKFSRPFKFLPYVTLFSVLGGGLAVQRLLGARRAAHVGAAAVVAALMLWHCHATRASEYSFADRPYPAAPPWLLARVADPDLRALRRVFSVDPERSTLPDFPLGLHLEFATVYRAHSAHGFDPLVEGTPETLDALQHVIDAPFSALALGYPRPGTRPGYDPVPALRHWGVRWIVAHPSAFAPVFGANREAAFLEKVDALSARQRDTLIAAATLVHSAPPVSLWQLPDVDPLAFEASSPERPLPFLADASGVRVPLGGDVAGELVVNVRWRPALRASVDGAPAPCTRDAWGRVNIPVRRGARVAEVRLVVGWWRGFAASFVLALMAAGVAFVGRRPRP